MMAYLQQEKDANLEMIGLQEFLQQNEAKELTPQLLAKFEIIPNSIDLSLPDKRTLDWKFFVDFVKPSRTIEVMKVSTDQDKE